ncbi:BRCT domain-containing protein [Ralstonia sp.]|uniref:BRCT domain-containing protein n=1 Tax=Ralstonia sp. TaxID=54061 RepID=UPI002D090CD0|nr:WYL domain-containing protein [Ralstonia sp.]HWV06543.1 WYL domain-containing protein [Ralstonia sp.]
MQDVFAGFGTFVVYVWLTVWGWLELVRGHVARGGPRWRAHLIALFAAHVPAVAFVLALAMSAIKEPDVVGALLTWLAALGIAFAYHRYGQGINAAHAPVKEQAEHPSSTSERVVGTPAYPAKPEASREVLRLVRKEREDQLKRASRAKLHSDGFVSNVDPSKPLPAVPARQRASQSRADSNMEPTYQYGEERHYPTSSIDPIQLPDTISFRYRKADGTEKRRTVTAFQIVDMKGRPYMDAHDHDRKATRSFLVSRIVGEVTRSETGEVMSAASWLSAVSMSQDSTRRKERTRRKAEAGDWQTAVVFAGLHPARRDALEGRALEAGWDVRERITRTVAYVVAGPLVGHKQLARAEEFGIPVVDEDGVLALMTGALPGDQLRRLY